MLQAHTRHLSSYTLTVHDRCLQSSFSSSQGVLPAGASPPSVGCLDPRFGFPGAASGFGVGRIIAAAASPSEFSVASSGFLVLGLLEAFLAVAFGFLVWAGEPAAGSLIAGRCAAFGVAGASCPSSPLLVSLCPVLHQMLMQTPWSISWS